MSEIKAHRRTEDVLLVASQRDEARAQVSALQADAARLETDLAHWTSGRRRRGVPAVESVPDGLHYAAELVRAQGTEGGERHDQLLREAGMRLKALTDASGSLLAEAVVLRADVAQLAADRDSLRKAGEEMERQRDEVRAERDTYRSVIEAYEAGVAQIEAERDEALRMLARHQSEESARWMPAVRERDAMKADLASLAYWYCANCERRIPDADVQWDEDRDGFCPYSTDQLEWCEPETLTSVKAYAEKLREGKNRAFAERNAMRPVVDALAELVGLKDGPRIAEYYNRKSGAWQRAREALYDLGQLATWTPAATGDTPGALVPGEGDTPMPLDAALRELVALKDGPRDAQYRDRKEGAWQRAREALDQMGARTDRGEPQSDESGSGVAQDAPETSGAQKGAQGAGDRPPVVWRHPCGWEQVSPIPRRCPSRGGDKAWGGAP